MTRHGRHESVREILNGYNLSYIPFRSTPQPSNSATPATAVAGSGSESPQRSYAFNADEDQLSQFEQFDIDAATTGDAQNAGQKRSSPPLSDVELVFNPHQPKKPRTGSVTPTGHEEPLRGRKPSFPRSPADTPRVRSISPGSLSFAEAAETMLNRAEELGGNKITKLTRGHPASPVPRRSSPRPSSRQASEPISTAKAFARKSSTSTQVLDNVGLAEYFQQDDRPVFVLDLDAPATDSLPIAFANTALRHKPGLYEYIHGRSQDAGLFPDTSAPLTDFKTWLLGEQDAQSISSSFPFGGLLWRVNTLRKRLRVVIGTEIQSPSADSSTQQRRRPTIQTSKPWNSSISAQRAARRSVVEAPGYFDMKPTNRKMETPSTMEGLVVASTSDTDQDGSVEILSNGPLTTASHGDSGMHDLLNAPVSPQDETNHFAQTFFPLRSDPECLQPMRMDYLSDKGFFDWTRLPMSPSLPDHIQFAKSYNWANTSLGPIEEWPADLRGMCNLIMASPHPAAMYWGPDNIAIYNEPYIMLAGNKHPDLMGSRYQDAWKEIWHLIEDVFQVAMDSAQATMKDDDCLFIMRSGFLEETYFSWSIIPLIGDDGSVVGLYNPAFEKTRRKIAERRMLTLREIGERTSAARAISDFWSLLIEGFEYNEYDAPLVIVYSLNDAEDSDAASSASSTAAASKQCRLEGTLGVPRGHPCCPETIDLKHDTKGFGGLFKQAINAERPIVLSTTDGAFDASLLQGIEWRGFGDPSRSVVISPIRPTTGESTLGFLVMGTNPRRPYDEDYDLFVQLLSRQLATSIASVVLFEDEIRKGERAAQMAAQDRIDLTNQLAVRTQEAVESENKFTRMAELAPVGMLIGDEAGRITFANDAWYRISSYPHGKEIENNWIHFVNDNDKDNTWQAWTSMLKKKAPMSVEFRFKTPWRDKFGDTNDLWVLASASPELDDDGNITRVFGSVTDISSQKFAEGLQRKRMEEAMALKQQQERYIDTTSHEMRNPLSAILQSADAITSSLTELKNAGGLGQAQLETIESTIESSQTITLCAQHQKRIVDDVLTLSKLDSAMLLVTPVDTQPEAIARRTVKMFEGESQTVDIKLSVQVDKSYRSLAIDYVRLDPTRLSQVLINLMTNAIKFTTTQEKRVIKMHLAASRERPSQEANYNLTYIPSQAPKDKDVTAAAQWGLGEPLYIHFAVSDTGRGLDDTEKKQLFQRFSQANPRTHVTYGGSGLGLFISRELVELQGGEIGVASESGKGSTFAFYVKVRRSQAPVSGSEEDIMDVHHLADRKASASAAHKAKLSRIQTHITDTDGKPTIVSPRTTVTQLTKLRTDASGLRVLIVEDNLINQKVLAAQLKKLGCIVSLANHGGEAIDHIKRTSFYKYHDPALPETEIDIVLMDLEMPVMDGMTCARALRTMQMNGALVRHVPVIAVTANAREEQIKNTLDAGIDDVVSKPFRIPELVPKMRDTIARFSQPPNTESPPTTKMDISSSNESAETIIGPEKAAEGIT